MSATGRRCGGDGPLSPLREAEAGATLLEMLVVVGLMAMISTVGLASFRPALRRAALSAQAGALRLSLAQTRAVALRTGRATTLVVASDGRSYDAAGRSVALAGGQRLASDPDAVVFAGDGASRGARLRLTAGRRRLDFVVSTDGSVSRGPG